jgi:hypothetical protein
MAVPEIRRISGGQIAGISFMAKSKLLCIAIGMAALMLAVRAFAVITPGIL